MPVAFLQQVTYESTVNANTVTIPWDEAPREGNTGVLIYNGDGGPEVDDFFLATGWQERVNADNVTGAFIFDKTFGRSEPDTVTIPLKASVSHCVYMAELTSTEDVAGDLSAKNTSGGSFATSQSSGNTSPEFAGMAQGDETVFVAYSRKGDDFQVTGLAAGLTQIQRLVGQGTNPVTLVVAKAALTDQASSLEYVSTISGGSLEPGGMLATYRARQAGLVGRAVHVEFEIAPNTKDVQVTNSGAGTLDWTAGADSDWISVAPASGTAPSTLSVTALAAGLAPDVYEGEVDVASAGASNTPLALPVTFTVGSETRLVGTRLTVVYETEGVMFLTFESGGEAGAVIRRMAAAIGAVAMPLPDSNPTGPPVVLSFAVDPDTGQRSVSLSGGGLSDTQTVVI